MRLQELSVSYRSSAAALRERAAALERQRRETQDITQQRLLEERIHMLETMWREARDLAVLCERYYERGYRRNVKYTL